MNRNNKGNPPAKRGIELRVLPYALASAVTAVALLLTCVRWDAGRPREEWFAARKGSLVAADVRSLPASDVTVAGSVRLRSDTGLTVELRVIRPAVIEAPLPVLVILGGHRTGRDAVELVAEATERAIVALDYPYDGAHRIRGLQQTLAALPHIRRAFLDTPPAISLTLDWLYLQPWADREQLVMVGASLGVPFAATAAARDERLTALLLVHGAADNRSWLEVNVARRIGPGILQGPLATVLHWLAYGPVFDTRERLAAVSPRPVLIVGAREDERAPPGATKRLFEAAHEPKKLRWTEGLHVAPGRMEVIDELLAIADEELPLDPASAP